MSEMIINLLYPVEFSLKSLSQIMPFNDKLFTCIWNYAIWKSIMQYPIL